MTSLQNQPHHFHKSSSHGIMYVCHLCLKVTYMLTIHDDLINGESAFNVELKWVLVYLINYLGGIGAGFLCLQFYEQVIYILFVQSNLYVEKVPCIKRLSAIFSIYQSCEIPVNHL